MSENSLRFDATDLDGTDVPVEHQVPTSEAPQMYDLLREQLATPANTEPIVRPVAGRQGVSVIFDIDIEVELFQAWLKRATNRRTKQTNARTLANIMFSNQHRGTLINGNEVLTPEGKPMTFNTPELQQMLKAGGPNEAITKMYGLDGRVIQHMKEIIDAAGFGDEDMEWEDEFGQDTGPLGN